MNAPDVIYLQWHGDAPTTYFDDDDNEVEIPEEDMEGPSADDYYSEDVTWCAERIYDADIPYRRERECEWRRTDEPTEYETACGGLYGVTLDTPGEDDYLYCPGCTGTIRIVEGGT